MDQGPGYRHRFVNTDWLDDANANRIADLQRGMRRGDVIVGTPTFSIEVITVPVSEVDRAVRFYVDQVGFTLNVDYSPNDAFLRALITWPCLNDGAAIDFGFHLVSN